MKTLFSVLRVLLPIFNDSAAEQKGTKASALLLFAAASIGLFLTFAEPAAVVAPVVQPAPIEAPTPAPDVQDEDTDASDILDVIDPPDAGGDLVVLSTVRVSWDRSYDPPMIHRRDSDLGGWAEYVARQRAYRRGEM